MGSLNYSGNRPSIIESSVDLLNVPRLTNRGWFNIEGTLNRGVLNNRGWFNIEGGLRNYRKGEKKRWKNNNPVLLFHYFVQPLHNENRQGLP